MSDHWNPWEPEGSRPPERRGERGPDPEPIVRTVRVAFLFAGMLVAVMVNAGLNRLAVAPPPDRLAGGSVTAVVAVLVLAVMLGAAWALRPARLLLVGKRALLHPDPRQRRPRAERARAMGFRGLAMAWAGQALLFGLLPAFAGLVLELLHGWRWELLAFAGVSLLAGFVYQLQVTGAVRLAVDDPELRASYGSR
jgi:MFS family permease